MKSYKSVIFLLFLAFCFLSGCGKTEKAEITDASAATPASTAPLPQVSETPSATVTKTPSLSQPFPTPSTGAEPSPKPQASVTVTKEPEDPTATVTAAVTATKKPQKPTATPTPLPTYAPGTVLGSAPKLSHPDHFYSSAISVSISAEKKGTIYYTTDGSEPTKNAKKYSSPIALSASGANTPKATVLRAKAYYEDGSESPTVVHTYFVGSNVASRFTTLVFCISGNPADLTGAPNGILYGTNYEQRGRQSERAIYLEVFNKNGSPVISQYAGARVYGGASRQNAVKSLKLFASLMKRKDCREYFVKKILELSGGALSYSSVNAMLNIMTKLQKPELSIYMSYLQKTHNCWTNEWSTSDSLEQIRSFARKRPDEIVNMLAKNLGMTEEEILALKP